MNTITQHAPGTFSWPELMTTDQEGARKFYSALFGWESADMPMGEKEIYTIFKLGGRDVGALCTIRKEQRDQGVPPNWQSYVTVENADAAAQKATSLGGTVLMAPFDVMEHGRMAVIRDPQGAVFCVWQANKNPGATVLNEVGALVWTELATTDTKAASQFYTSLFPWKANPMEGPGEYTRFLRADGNGAGGMMPMAPGQNMPPYWLPYFNVQDCAATVEKGKSLGGRVIMGPHSVPTVGTFAIFMDPQGAAFAVIQPTPM
jgi:predicted enzyme related to lactoylglutathione lyase